MVHELLSTEVNLRTSPTHTHKKPLKQVTLGDLHANAIKLIHTLVRYGVCEISDTPFKEMGRLYEKRNPTEADKRAFLKLIADALKVKNKKILVRLIGDIVADRGKNDLYVLAILESLRVDGVSVSTLVSNHDVELILAYEAYKKNSGILEARVGVGIIDQQKTSLKGLVDSIGDGKTISKDDFESYMENDYLPTLKLVDYSLSETDPKHITIFSHAPIDLEVIEHMSKKFGVTHAAKTVEELAHTMDEINQKFVSCVRDGNFNVIYDGSKVPGPPGHVAKKNCIECAIWNRNEDLDAGSKDIAAEHITFVYGHTKGGAHQRTNVAEIDNTLGKGEGNDEGIDPVFVSDEPLSTLRYTPCASSEYITPRIVVDLKRRLKTFLDVPAPDMLEYVNRKRAVLVPQATRCVQEISGLNSVTDKERITKLEQGVTVAMKRIDAYLALRRFQNLSRKEAEKKFLIAEFGMLDEALIQKIQDAEVSQEYCATINDALIVLKDYSAGTAVGEQIQSIQDDMDKKDFKQALVKVETLKKNSFEGLGARAIDGDKRGVCEKAWYNIIAGIRFFLGLMTSLFTKQSNHENPVAKVLLGRPFFFQKSLTKGEDALIQQQLEMLEKAKDALNDGMNPSGALEP